MVTLPLPSYMTLIDRSSGMTTVSANVPPASLKLKPSLTAVFRQRKAQRLRVECAGRANVVASESAAVAAEASPPTAVRPPSSRVHSLCSLFDQCQGVTPLIFAFSAML